MTATFHPASTYQRTGCTPVRARPRSVVSGDSHDVAPNYAARRIAAALVALAVLAAGAVAVVETVGALADLGGRPAAASEASAATGTGVLQRSVHVAVPGDSLWSIADLYRGPVSRDRYVDALIGLNGGTSIQAGQAIRLP